MCEGVKQEQLQKELLIKKQINKNALPQSDVVLSKKSAVEMLKGVNV